MKKVFLYFFLLICGIALAQESTDTSLKVSESEPFPETKSASDILGLHRDSNNNSVMVRKGKRNINIDIFDINLKRTKNRFIEISRKESFIGEFFEDDVLKIFTLEKKDKKTRVVKCYYLSLEKGYFEEKELFETTVERKQTLFGGEKKKETNFTVSPNGEYFVMNTSNIKKDVNSYTVRVFKSSSLELVYEKSYQTNKEKYFESNDLFIDDNATVFALGKSFLSGKSQRKKNKANYTFVLNKISENNEQTLELSLTDEHIQSLTIKELNKQFHLIGFYSNKNTNRVKGYCDFVINTKDLVLEKQIKNELPASVYTDLYGNDSKGAKKKSELSNFEIDYVLTDSKGNSYIVSEEFYITSTYVAMGQFGGTWTTVYHYDDIFVLKIDPDGKLLWGRSIFKRSTEPSYNTFLKNDELYVILNSGKRLVKKKDGRTKVSQGLFESSALYNIIFRETGEVVYEKIQNNRKKSYYLPYYGNYDFDRFIMPNNVINKKRFMILE